MTHPVVMKVCGPTCGCGGSMPLDARFCPHCGQQQAGSSTYYALHPHPSSLFPIKLIPVPGTATFIVSRIDA